MNNVRLRIALCVTLMCLKEAASLWLPSQPEKFARERYERSRNRNTTKSVNPKLDAQLIDFVALVNQFGYPGEEHLVSTADGYRLRVHRIPGSTLRGQRVEERPVVFFQHGLLGSSDVWVLLGPTKDLAYMLVDAGYDVWLGNVRGNTYSRSHVRLSPDYDPEFWQFSFHEVAIYDVTAAIDYILQVTGQRSIIYIGHSMGTTIIFALLSTRPEYNEKISLAICLAPVALWHAPSQPFVRFLIENTDAIKNFVLKARIYELFPLTEANAHLAKKTCSDDSIFQQLCLSFLYYMFGYNPGQLNSTIVSYIISYLPAGTSAQTLIHYSQNMKSGDFKMYDYGPTKNVATYKLQEPPSYNLNNIVAPVALFYGRGDALVSPGNPIELSKKLPNVVIIEDVGDERFNHVDFLFSRDVKTLVNNRVMDTMTKVLRRGRTL